MLFTSHDDFAVSNQILSEKCCVVTSTWFCGKAKKKFVFRESQGLDNLYFRIEIYILCLIFKPELQ